MPRHKQVTTCRRTDGPVSKHCPCEHCALSVCSVCGGGEGSLTTDCPGVKIDGDRQQELCETKLDYTDDRGWHLAVMRRSPRFEAPKANADPAAICQACGARCPPNLGPTYGCQVCGNQSVKAPDALAGQPTTDWTHVDRTTALKDVLAQKGIAWVLAERIAEQHSADLGRAQNAVAERTLLSGGAPPDARAQDLHAKLERAKIDFHLADQRAVCCDDEFHQAARQLVTALEGPTAIADADDDEEKA